MHVQGSLSVESLIAQAERSKRQAREPGRRRIFLTAMASGVAAAAAPAWSQSGAAPGAGAGALERLTVDQGGRGPSRFHSSFVKDVGLITDLNGFVQPESIPFNKGDYNGFAMPKCHVRFV